MLHNLQKIGRQRLDALGEFDALVWPLSQLQSVKKKAVFAELILDLDAVTAAAPSETTDPVGWAAMSRGRLNDANGVDADWLWHRGGVRMTGGPNGRSHYFAVRAKNLKNLYKSLFGKDGKGSELLDWTGIALSDELRIVLQDLRVFEPALLALLGSELKNGVPTFKDKKLVDWLELDGKTEELQFVYLSVKSDKHGIPEAKPLAQVGNYLEVYRDKMSLSTAADEPKELCYLEGTPQAGAGLPDYEGRYNLNKTFITETVNYAPGFEKKGYQKSFRLSPEAARTLDAASGYLLNHLRVYIAGVSHVLIPHALGDRPFSTEQLSEVKDSADLVFSGKAASTGGSAARRSAKRDKTPYWITFLAYDSNGNFFKVVNQIQDVPSFYFRKIEAVIRRINNTPTLSGSGFFSLYSVYQSIPLVGEGPRNEALELLKAILENRPIADGTLWKYFSRLLLAHRFGRYKKHPNVYEPFKGKNERLERVADAGYGNAVQVYTQLRILLGQLGLLSDYSFSFENLPPTMDLEQRFAALGYSERQRGLFYLGRALNQVAYAQFKKGNSKRILGKINFNGMDARSLIKLYNDLTDTARVYSAAERGNDSVLDKINYNLNQFNARFDPDTWTEDNEALGGKVDPQKSLYFLMAGYAYVVPKRKGADDEVENQS